MLVAQVLWLDSYGKEVAGHLQIAGAVIVFLTAFLGPLLDIYVFKTREEEEEEEEEEEGDQN